jgi:general secretion pathway protein C
MEKLFRKQFWVLHVVFLALTAWLAARAVNTGVGAMLKAEPAALTAASGAKRSAPRARNRNFEAATDANIFNARREKVEELPEGATGCKEDTDCEEGGKCEEGICVKGDPKNDIASAVPTELRVRLVGTAVFTDAEFSLASIVDESGGRNAEADLYSINPCPESSPGPDGGPPLIGAQRVPCNDLVDKAEIRLIDADRVYIFNKSEDRFEYIELGKEDGKQPRVAAAKPKEKKKSKRKNKFADELGDHIKKTGDNTWEVEQEGVNKALGDLSKLATQARIVPAFEGGEAVGFKLFSIRPGSLYSKIGVQNGDVIKRINGYELNSPDKALEVYQKLKDAKEISLDLKRRGKPMSLSYNIVP